MAGLSCAEETGEQSTTGVRLARHCCASPRDSCGRSLRLCSSTSTTRARKGYVCVTTPLPVQSSIRGCPRQVAAYILC